MYVVVAIFYNDKRDYFGDGCVCRVVAEKKSEIVMAGTIACLESEQARLEKLCTQLFLVLTRG